MNRPASIAVEKKFRIALSVVKGESTVVDVARREGVSEQTVRNWRRQFIEAGKAGLLAGQSKSSSREQQLEEQVAELTQALGEAAIEIRSWQKSLRTAGPIA